MVRTRKRGKTYSYIFEAGKTASGKRKVIEKGAFVGKPPIPMVGEIHQHTDNSKSVHA